MIGIWGAPPMRLSCRSPQRLLHVLNMLYRPVNVYPMLILAGPPDYLFHNRVLRHVGHDGTEFATVIGNTTRQQCRLASSWCPNSDRSPRQSARRVGTADNQNEGSENETNLHQDSRSSRRRHRSADVDFGAGRGRPVCVRSDRDERGRSAGHRPR